MSFWQRNKVVRKDNSILSVPYWQQLLKNLINSSLKERNAIKFCIIQLNSEVPIYLWTNAFLKCKQFPLIFLRLFLQSVTTFSQEILLIWLLNPWKPLWIRRNWYYIRNEIFERDESCFILCTNKILKCLQILDQKTALHIAVSSWNFSLN